MRTLSAREQPRAVPQYVRRSRQSERPQIAIATNNGDMGGGEVMLLNIAEALRSLGMRVLVLGPQEPGGLAVAAAERGFVVEALPARGRLQWMLALRAWRWRNRRIPLWCNGLVPSIATAFLGPRLVHLHIIPTGAHAILAAIARLGARRTIVVSRFMASRVPGRTAVMENWTEDIPFTPRAFPTSGAIRIGFMGRLTRDKGVHVLAQAIQSLTLEEGRQVRFVLGGENRFGTSQDDRVIADALEPLGDAVEHLGWVTREEFFASVDVAVFPSTWDEPFGLVAAEAMAAGVPFVISDAGGLVEVAGPNHPWTARRGDSADLTRVLQRLLDSDPEAVLCRTHAARLRWEERFSPAGGRHRVARLIQRLTEEVTL